MVLSHYNEDLIQTRPSKRHPRINVRLLMQKEPHHSLLSKIRRPRLIISSCLEALKTELQIASRVAPVHETDPPISLKRRVLGGKRKQIRIARRIQHPNDKENLKIMITQLPCIVRLRKSLQTSLCLRLHAKAQRTILGW